MSGILYVVGTPIGNLGDFSERAKETLKAVDFIAAEDTRVTVKLLNHFNIKKPLISYYEHNKREKGTVILDRLLSGENGAVVTDAGMPCISDPGEDLVALCAQHEVKTVVVPGPSAVISALAVSGLSTGRFSFEGFLSVNRKSRMEHLESLKDERRTMVFYEAPHKLKNTLIDFYATFGKRKLTIARELTKLHEEVIRTDTETAAAEIAETGLKGELVLILEGKPEDDEPEMSLDEAVAVAKKLIDEGMKPTAAAKEAAALSHQKKNDIYRRLL